MRMTGRKVPKNSLEVPDAKNRRAAITAASAMNATRDDHGNFAEEVPTNLADGMGLLSAFAWPRRPMV
jgi:hypothetical protein